MRELISFETAKIAKQKGFDEKCTDFYENGELISISKFIKYGYISACNSGFTETSERYSAPEQSELQRWLRQNFDVHIMINSLKPNDNSYYRILYDFRKQDYLINRGKLMRFNTYEDALEYSLIEALSLI